MAITIRRADTNAIVSAGSTLTIEMGTTLTLIATSSINAELSWFSSTVNNNIFIIGDGGTDVDGGTVTITPVAVGQATYRLFCWEGNTTNAGIYIQVVDGSGGGGDSGDDDDLIVDHVEIYVNGSWHYTNTEFSMNGGDTATLRGRVMLSDNSYAYDVTWSVTSGSSYINISDLGSGSILVTANNVDGVAVLRCESNADPSKYIDQAVIISYSEEEEATPTAIFLFDRSDNTQIENETTIMLNAGERKTLYAKVVMSDNTFVDPPAAVNWALDDDETMFSIVESTRNMVTIEAGTTGGTANSPLFAILTYNGATVYTMFYVAVYAPIVEPEAPYSAWICNAAGVFEEYEAYICNAAGVWEAYDPDICPFTEKDDEPTVTVTAVSGATYGFAKNSSGYWESQNAGQSSSYAICKVTITTPGGYAMYVDCINGGESIYDFGILSMIGSTLSLSNSADSTGVMRSFSGATSTDIQTVSYGTLASGTHFFYAKYLKDGSVNNAPDSLQFKVRFEK